MNVHSLHQADIVADCCRRDDQDYSSEGRRQSCQSQTPQRARKCQHSSQLAKTGVRTSLRRLSAPSALFKEDFECNSDVSTVRQVRLNRLKLEGASWPTRSAAQSIK